MRESVTILGSGQSAAPAGVELRAALDLQQGQLRLLWQQLQERGDTPPRNLAEEIPPHY